MWACMHALPLSPFPSLSRRAQKAEPQSHAGHDGNTDWCVQLYSITCPPILSALVLNLHESTHGWRHRAPQRFSFRCFRWSPWNLSDSRCDTDRPRLGRLQAQFSFDYHVKITPAVWNERCDIEIKDYVALLRGERQLSTSLPADSGQDNCLPPCPLILDFTMTHDRFGRSRLHPSGKLTHTALRQHSTSWWHHKEHGQT